MKKSILFFISILSLTLLSGCFTYQRSTTQTSTTFLTESPLDYNKIQSEIYSKVYSEIKRDIYDQLVDELKQEFLNGTIDYDDLQSRIIKTVSIATKGNVYVLNQKYNDNHELVAASSGSGVIFDSISDPSEFSDYESNTLEKEHRYYVITNEHVVKNGDGFQIVFEDDTSVDAFLIGSDDTNDIALLYFDSNNTYNVMTLGNSDEISIGEIVLAIGNPKGESLFGSVTMGVVGGVNRNLIDSNGTKNTINKYIQHDAAINGGNSGGGLYNLDGEVIGINSVKYVSTSTSEIEGLNFAIPINLVKDIISEIRQFGKYDGTVTFGITVTEVGALTSAGRANYNVPDEVSDGVIVISITAGGSSYGVLLENDILIRADGETVLSTSDLAKVLSRHRIGDTINLTVLRNGVETELSLTFHRTVEVVEDTESEE